MRSVCADVHERQLCTRSKRQQRQHDNLIQKSRILQQVILEVRNLLSNEICCSPDKNKFIATLL